MKGIADTGFIVAFGNRGDSHHLWAVDLAQDHYRTVTHLRSRFWPKPHFIWDQAPMFSPWCRMKCCGSHLIAPATWISYADFARRYRRS